MYLRIAIEPVDERAGVEKAVLVQLLGQYDNSYLLSCRKQQPDRFAVVAAEVRNLAQRSAGAAKEIKALIDDSVEKVDVGSALTISARVSGSGSPSLPPVSSLAVAKTSRKAPPRTTPRRTQ